MKRIVLVFLFTFKISSVFSQGIMIALASGSPAYIPETKVLDKFPLYPTIKKYDFKGKSVKIEFKDVRDSLNLKKVDCSDVVIENKTEFKSTLGSQIVNSYIDSLFVRSNLILDENNYSEIISIRLHALDTKLNGFLISKVHGICQMSFTLKNYTKTYCIDLQDGDAHAPVGRMTMISKRRAKELLICSSIREVIELFLIDLENYKEN